MKRFADENIAAQIVRRSPNATSVLESNKYFPFCREYFRPIVFHNGHFEAIANSNRYNSKNMRKT